MESIMFFRSFYSIILNELEGQLRALSQFLRITRKFVLFFLLVNYENENRAHSFVITSS